MASLSTAPGITRKVTKVLDTRIDGPELRASLVALSGIYPDNTPAARRRLRAAIDAEGIRAAEALLQGLDALTGELDVACSALDALAGACRGGSDALAAARGASGALLNEHAALERQLAGACRRAASIADFQRRYQLSPEEADLLTKGDDLPPGFFEALEHAREVHANCRALVGGPHQRGALGLMERMASLQESAYERLYRWVHAHAGEALAAGSGVDPEGSLARAVSALRGRPVLLAYCLEEVTAARHAALFQQFIAALTRGPRPIEVHAGEPRRYVADLLAWVHAALEAEREALAGLLGTGDGDGEPAEQGQTGEGRAGEGAGGVEDPAAALVAKPRSDGPSVPTLEQMLDRVFESIRRPLKVRLEQCLLAAPAPVLCFWVGQVLTFYVARVERVLGPGSGLAGTLEAVRSMALHAFREQLRQQRDKLARFAPAPPRDLLPPAPLLRGAGMLAELVACHDAALDPGCAAAGDDFGALLDAALAPLLAAAEQGAEALDPGAATRLDDGAHLDPADRAVYLINCLAALLAPLDGAACGAAAAARLRLTLADELSALADAEAGRVLARCGLAAVAARMRLHGRVAGAGDEAGGGEAGERNEALPATAPTSAAEAPLAKLPGLGLEDVTKALRDFFQGITQPDAIPEFAKLQLPRAREELIQRVSASVAATHAMVCAALLDPGNGYDPAGAAAAIRHSPQDVATLLGVH